MTAMAKMIERWNKDNTPVEVRLMEALFRLDKAYDDRLALDRRIHNQRASLRQTWEIVEMRRNYMGSPASRSAYARLLKRHQKLLSEQQRLGPEFEKVLRESLSALYVR